MSKKGIIGLIVAIVIIILVVAGFAIYRNREPENNDQMTQENNNRTEENAAAENQVANVTTEPQNNSSDKRVAIVYYSWGQHTEQMAKVIANKTHGTLVKIEPVTPYPTDYTECTEVALDQKNKNERPAIKPLGINLEDYDTVFVGYPNWWGDMPMVLYTFLEQNNFAGKTVIPFMTSYSSGTSGTFTTIKNTLKSANVLEGIHISQSKIDRNDYETEMNQWLNKLSY